MLFGIEGGIILLALNIAMTEIDFGLSFSEFKVSDGDYSVLIDGINLQIQKDGGVRNWVISLIVVWADIKK